MFIETDIISNFSKYKVTDYSTPNTVSYEQKCKYLHVIVLLGHFSDIDIETSRRL